MTAPERPTHVGGSAQTVPATADYTGRLRSDGKGGVEGWMTDRLGARIHFVGVRDTAGGGYLLTGTVVLPEYLKMDGEP